MAPQRPQREYTKPGKRRCNQNPVSLTTNLCLWSGPPSYTIALSFAKFGQNNLHSFDAPPHVSLFTCDMSEVSAAITGTPGCAIADTHDVTTVGPAL